MRTIRLLIFMLLAAGAIAALLLLAPAAVPAPAPAPEQPLTQQNAAIEPLATTTIIINGVSIVAEVADTPATEEKGLGGRDSLADGTGMWFTFSEPSAWGIWMKDMKFPIDVLWLDAEKKIVTIVPHMTPDSFPQAYYPDSDASYVLELPDGAVEKYRFSVGDVAEIEK